jgi:tetratricopeptide (TPR) repeat protein
VLQLTREQMSKRIYFGEGSIVFARTNQRTERLGEFLIRKGRITRSHLADASNKLRARGEKLGAILVQMGVMSDTEVREAVADQMRSMIRPVFSWKIGEYCFQPQAEPIPEELVVNLPTIPTILDGTRDVRDMKIIENALGDLERVVSYSRDPWVHAYHLSLTPEEGFVLSRVDGQSSMNDILSITPLPDEEALRCLYTLVAGGFLEFGAKSRDLAPLKRDKAFFEIPIGLPRSAGAVPSSLGSKVSAKDRRTYDEIVAKRASMDRGTFYDWLELPRTAKNKDIRKAYLDLVKRYHPDRHSSEHLRELHSTLEDIIAKATQAYERLCEPTSKRRYDQSLRTEAPKGEAMAPRVEKVEPLPPTPGEELAARYYREAKRFYAERRFHEAVKLLEEVVELDPSKPEHHRLLAQALSNNPKWRKDAEKHFRQAMKMDPFDLESIVGLGDLYHIAGMKQRAKAMYTLALEIDPDDAELKMKLRRR